MLVVGVFTFSPFKLPHYGLPAFPALALVVAALWEETLARRPGALSARALVAPIALLFAATALAAAAAWGGLLPVGGGPMETLDVTARNLAAQGQEAAQRPFDAFRPVLALCAVVFGLGAVALGVAAWRRSAELGLIAAMAVMLAFLPAAGRGMVEFARGRSAGPIAAALARRLQPGDVVAHEGALENSASVLLTLRRPVHVVEGLVSNLAFGATFADARDIFWTAAELREAWSRPGRRFLISVVAPERSVVRSLPPGSVHLLAEGGGRWLYSNRPD
jgi:4-amino-4-deoxy-L-arabinose transferase-like glycosyltransferase